MSQTWARCLHSLKNSLPLSQFSVWVSPLSATESSSKLVLGAPNTSVLKYINNNTNNIKTAILQAVAEQNKSLKVQIGIAEKKPITQPKQNNIPPLYFLNIPLTTLF